MSIETPFSLVAELLKDVAAVDGLRYLPVIRPAPDASMRRRWRRKAHSFPDSVVVKVPQLATMTGSCSAGSVGQAAEGVSGSFRLRGPGAIGRAG